MELQVTTLSGEASGSVTVPDGIFGLEPRRDILQRCVVWQLAKRQRGTHDVKNRAEIHRTGKTRRIGPDHIRKCVRILQLLEVAEQPEDMNIAGLRFHGLRNRNRA